MLTPLLLAKPLKGEIWLSLDMPGIPDLGEPYKNKSPEQVRDTDDFKELMEDARWIFSGMVYGYEIRWRPSDRQRGIKEVLDFKVIAMIPQEDFNKSKVNIVYENGLYFVEIEFNPSPMQAEHIESWKSRLYPVASGTSASFYYYYDSRRKAIEDAIKESIKAWLQAREYNVPNEIRMRVGLQGFPLVMPTGVSLWASVNIAMQLDAIIPYIFH